MKIEYNRIFTNYNGESVAIVEMDREALENFIEHVEYEAYVEIGSQDYDRSLDLLLARSQLLNGLEELKAEAEKGSENV